MSSLQAAQHADRQGARTSSSATGQRFLHAPGEVTWSRSDWGEPVGAFFKLSVCAHDSCVRGHEIPWNSFEVDELWLGRKASLLLLQGMPLSQLLIPNHRIDHYTFDEPLYAGHVILRVDPWQYWLPQPKLTGLVLAQLGDLPAEVSAAEVFGALIADSAA